jgi:hypothetical protein
MALYIDSDITKCTNHEFFKDIYYEINKCHSIKNFNYSNMNPILLSKLNGNIGASYFNMLYNEIICHTISSMIIKNKIGSEVFSSLNDSDLFINNLKNFFKKYNTNKNIRFIMKIDNKLNPNKNTESNLYQEF